MLASSSILLGDSILDYLEQRVVTVKPSESVMLVALILAAILGSPWQRPLQVTVHPQTVYLEKGATHQFLNFDFMFENPTDERLQLELIRMSAFDEEGRLLRRLRLDRNAVSPSMNTLPTAELEGGGTLFVFNPFHTFDSELRLVLLRYEFIFASENGGTQLAETIVTPARYETKTRLVLPLRGRIIVDDGHDFYAHHRRVNLDHPFVKQIGATANAVRYAYDFCAVNEAGELHRGDGERLEEWFGFGDPVFSPGDGVIAEAVNDMPDNTLVDGKVVYSDALTTDDPKTFFGNYVIIDHQNGEFSYIAHLKLGSVRVKPGAKVLAGQLVGLMGLSGDTSFPHVHYQLQTGVDTFREEGLPSYFHDFRRVVGSQEVSVGRGHVDTGEVLESTAPGTEPSMLQAGRLLMVPAPDADRELKVLVYYDMEGLSGIDDWRMTTFSRTDRYRKGQARLVADVNAVVEGLFEGGADVVHVVDGHGSGNPHPDMPLERLDPRAQHILRDAPFDAYADLTGAGLYDAVAAVGMHAKTGSACFISHTMFLGTKVRLNDAWVTETEVVAYSWGRVGVPVIFASGDDVLARDLETMPCVEYVTVKTAHGADGAELKPGDEVAAQLRESAKRAIQNRLQARAMRLEPPLRVEFRAVHPASLSLLEKIRGIDYSGGNVSFTASDFAEATRGIQGLLAVAEQGYDRVLWDTIEAHPSGSQLEHQFVDDLLERYAEVENGEWLPTEQESAPKRKYHGYN